MFFLSLPPSLFAKSLKTISLILLSTLLATPLLMACSKVQSNEVPLNNPISINLVANTHYKLGQPIPITVIIKNETNNIVRFLKWGTPFEGNLTRDQFQINNLDNTLRYKGRMVKRGKPSSQDYILLNPKESLQTSIDISKAYPLIDVGQYSINYSASYLNLHALQKLIKVKSSNTVNLTLNP